MNMKQNIPCEIINTSIFYLLTSVFYLLPSISFAYDFAGGTGEPNDPYQIATAEQLISIGSDPNLLDKSFILINDIDLDPNLPGGQVFERAVIAPDMNEASLNFQGTAFNGFLDGQDYIIANLIIDSDSEYVGLFGYVYWYACIQNLHLEDVSIRGGSDVGGLVGTCSGTLIDCHVTGYVQGNKYVGLMAGSCHGIAQGCSVAGIVHGQSQVGGFVGFCTGTITGCEASGEVHGIESVGGLIGITRSSKVLSRCRSTAAVSGQHAVGGLLGRNGGYVRYCYADAVVSGDDKVGGLVGENTYLLSDVGFPGTVAYCYALGRVSGLEKVGGLAGVLQYQSQIHESYAASQVSGDMDAGGLVGFAWQDPDPDSGVFRSFWDLEVSQTDSSGGGFGRTTVQMQDPNTYLNAGWDLIGETENGTDDIWKIVEGKTYPLLSWQKYSGGTGEPNDPYQIATAEDLILLGETADDYDKHFILINDIDLDPNLPGGQVFDRAVIAPDMNDTSRNFQGIAFNGSLDGRDHTITNLIVDSNSEYAGLFGLIEEDGVVCHIHLVGGSVRGVAVYVPSGGGSRCGTGSLAGENRGIIEDCHSELTVTGIDFVGGLVGENRGNISDSSNASSVDGRNQVGGLVGFHNSGTIINSYNTGSIAGDVCVGGLVGYNFYGIITSSYSTGSVIGSNYVGGLVGRNSAYGVITSSYSTGGVIGSKYVGGLVGDNSDSSITSSYSTSSVIGNDIVGGLVGRNFDGLVKSSYSTGTVNGDSVVGGLVGDNDSGRITSSFWDTDTSEQDNSDGGVGLPTAQMQTVQLYLDAGWDFDTIWSICEGKDYPRLQWEGVVCE